VGLELGRVDLSTGVRVLVACQICGTPYGISPRTLRGMAQAKRLPICRTCRRPRLVSPKATMDHRKFWLDNYTIREIVDMAEEMWGPRDNWKPGEVAAVHDPDSLLPVA